MSSLFSCASSGRAAALFAAALISGAMLGRAADPVVCYWLGISGVCPIRFELYFKQFLNKDRMALNKLPDIDIDFPPRPEG